MTLEPREQAAPETLVAVDTLPEHQNLKLSSRVDSETAFGQLAKAALSAEIEPVRPLARAWGGPDRDHGQRGSEVAPAPTGWTCAENAHPQALSWAQARMCACLKWPGKQVSREQLKRLLKSKAPDGVKIES